MNIQKLNDDLRKVFQQLWTCNSQIATCDSFTCIRASSLTDTRKSNMQFVARHGECKVKQRLHNELEIWICNSTFTTISIALRKHKLALKNTYRRHETLSQVEDIAPIVFPFPWKMRESYSIMHRSFMNLFVLFVKLQLIQTNFNGLKSSVSAKLYVNVQIELNSRGKSIFQTAGCKTLLPWCLKSNYVNAVEDHCVASVLKWG